MSWRKVLLLALFVLAIWFTWAVVTVKNAFRGSEYVFLINPTDTLLTEELALAKARAALELGGLGEEHWDPVSVDMERSIEGQQDRYLRRNANDVNRGYFVFQSTSGRVRIVDVELTESRVTCTVCRPK